MTEATIPSRFPPELLQQSPATRLDYFKAYTVAHPALDQADKAVWSALREPAGAALVLVFGPTGVGKTTLLSHIETRLVEHALPQLEQDRGCLPVVKLNAMASTSRPFKWADFYQRALISIDEPLLEYKVGSRRDQLVLNDGRKRFQGPGRGMNLADLCLAWEYALRHRRTRAVLIDEAQHIAKTASGSKLLDQLDHLKSLAIMTKTVYVLVGTYDLLVFRNLSAQLSRRSIDVHFPRYRLDQPKDVRAFRSALWDFQRHLPLEQAPPLVQEWKHFYAQTIGCIGTLKDWLTRTLAEALEVGTPTFTPEMLARHALSAEQCEQMATDALEGETRLAGEEEAMIRLWQRLGLGTPPAKGREPQETSASAQRASAGHGRDSGVGQRNPVRDPLKGEVGHEG